MPAYPAVLRIRYIPGERDGPNSEDLLETAVPQLVWRTKRGREKDYLHSFEFGPRPCVYKLFAAVRLRKTPDEPDLVRVHSLDRPITITPGASLASPDWLLGAAGYEYDLFYTPPTLKEDAVRDERVPAETDKPHPIEALLLDTAARLKSFNMPGRFGPLAGSGSSLAIEPRRPSPTPPSRAHDNCMRDSTQNSEGQPVPPSAPATGTAGREQRDSMRRPSPVPGLPPGHGQVLPMRERSLDSERQPVPPNARAREMDTAVASSLVDRDQNRSQPPRQRRGSPSRRSQPSQSDRREGGSRGADPYPPNFHHGGGSGKKRKGGPPNRYPPAKRHAEGARTASNNVAIDCWERQEASQEDAAPSGTDATTPAGDLELIGAPRVTELDDKVKDDPDIKIENSDD